MAYSTPGMVRAALAPLADPTVQPVEPNLTNTAADLSDVELDDAISEADATIDSYIGARYAVPVGEVNGATPHPIDYWSRSIAAYLATLTFRGSQDLADADPVVRRYNATMTSLTAVRAGTGTLTLPANTGDSAASAAAPVNPYNGSLFSVDDFSVDGSVYPDRREPFFPYWSWV